MEQTIEERCDEWKARLVEAAVNFAFESQVSPDGADALNKLAKVAVDITPDVISHIKLNEKKPKKMGKSTSKCVSKERQPLCFRERVELALSVLFSMFLGAFLVLFVYWYFSNG